MLCRCKFCKSLIALCVFFCTCATAPLSSLDESIAYRIGVTKVGNPTASGDLIFARKGDLLIVSTLKTLHWLLSPPAARAGPENASIENRMTPATPSAARRPTPFIAIHPTNGVSPALPSSTPWAR